MKAIYVKEYGAAENLVFGEVENAASPCADEVKIRVRASGVNRADILQRLGKYPAPKGFSERILGLEFSGEIVEKGARADDFEIGDKVFGIISGGAQAEFLTTKALEVVKMPSNLSFAEAAAIPEAFMTAHDAVFSQGELKSGENLLIHAVGSGVGLAALQLGKAVNARVFGTSRTAEKVRQAEEIGLDKGFVIDEKILANTENFAETLRGETNGKGANVVLDLVGAKYLALNLAALAHKGRMIFVGTTSGARAEMDISIAMRKRLRLVGTVLRSRSAAEKAYATARFAAEVVPLFEKGVLRPNVEKVFEAAEIVEAHRYMEANKNFGKIVVLF